MILQAKVGSTPLNENISVDKKKKK